MSNEPFSWQHVPPDRRASVDALRTSGGEVAQLVRRGVDHGAVVIGELEPTPPDDPDGCWRASTPVHLPGVLGDALDAALDDAVATWHAFDELRRGGRLLDEMDRRLGSDEEFVYSGSTIDHDEPREIEKVFIDVPALLTSHGRRIRDLSVKLSWIADQQDDLSMRIRLSFGHETTRDWLRPDVRALWSDRLVRRAFPETECVTENAVISGFLGDVLPHPHRLNECILYSNAPGGGAMFHHDADPGQRGVVFAQLMGATVWLACPKHELAERAAARSSSPRLSSADAVLLAMDGDSDPELWTLLNATPDLTADLARAGHLFVLRGGDALLLPSHDVDACAWHSVFGVGGQPSLALSFGVFDALGDLPGAPPQWTAS